jgi:hypothetical protein
LSANIRLGWKGLPGTNALAYCAKALLTAVKSFITSAPDTTIHCSRLDHLVIKVFFVRLGWKGLPETNAIVYYEKA